MGLEALHIILTKSLTIVAWPPISLICPLYASIRALESDSRSSNQQCLAFWVLFSLSMIIEWELSVLFTWLPWWPHVKAMATILLLIPYFRIAPNIYKFLIKCCCTWNIGAALSIFNQEITNFELVEDEKTLSKLVEDSTPLSESDEDSKIDEVPGQIIITSHLLEEKILVCEGRDDLADCNKTENSCTMLTGQNQIQKEWSCALCQISTTSENCLRAHLKGKQHKAREKELRVRLHAMNNTDMLSYTKKRIKGMVLLRNLNQIANILSPLSRSMRWCEWEKPEFGWTKLNTDGSVSKETAGFGGLLRDYKGEPICAFVSKAPQGDIFLVELWAIWRGLILSLNLGITAVWVESDSMSVVNTVNKKQHCPKAASCVKQIRKLLKKFDNHRVSHSWRETNRAADHLAKMIVIGNDVVLWPADFPDSLRNIIKEDAGGKKYLRR